MKMLDTEIFIKCVTFEQKQVNKRIPSFRNFMIIIFSFKTIEQLIQNHSIKTSSNIHEKKKKNVVIAQPL